MHGLIFETSIWLLAGSTRLLFSCRRVCNQTCRNPSCKLFLEYVLGSESVAHSDEIGKYGLRDKWTQALSIIYLEISSHIVTIRCSQAVSALVIQPIVEIILQKKYGGCLLWRPVQTTTRWVRPAPKVIHRRVGEHQKHTCGLKDIANMCVVTYYQKQNESSIGACLLYTSDAADE